MSNQATKQPSNQAKVKSDKGSLDKLYYGDNLEVLRKYIKDESIDLCYIDPPFNSKRKYFQIYLNEGQQDKAQAQAFIDTWKWNELADDGLIEIINNEKNRFTTHTIQLINGLELVLGKGDLLAYLISMTLRIVEIHRVLKSTGSFYLHCDPTASHYLKLVLDSIFCKNGGDFQNEIIWCYSIGGKSKRKFGSKHDVIFFYTKSNKDIHIFNEDGASIPRKPNTHMKIGKDKDGRIYQEKVDRKSGKVYKYYIDKGKIAEDYWIDIETLNREDSERLGYPTQKPEDLLDRIIKTSTNKGDVVLDAYCGCGTTVSSAEKLKRKWIGIDITYQSVSLILKRIEESYGKKIKDNIELNGVPKDFESAVALANKKDDRVRKEFEKWCVLAYSDNKAMVNEKKGKDYGIDGDIIMSDYKSETDNEIILKNVYFSVKSDLKPHVSYIRDFYGTIQRDKAAFGIFITLHEPTKDMIDECKKFGNYKCNIIDKKYPIIKIVTVKDILKGERLEIPISHQKDVVKKAELKEDNSKQIKIAL